MSDDIALFKQLASMKQKQLRHALGDILEKKYTNVIRKKKYIIAEGNIPIALVAHLDTVFSHTPKHIYYDSEQKVMWSPEGLGADDRAGVYIILKILQSGYMPTVIFTTDEEIGGLGADALTLDYPNGPPWQINYIIELDRQGYKDCVFYNCGNQQFQEYVQKFDFEKDVGSFSDISIICPDWDIAGVNLSVGYIDEHTYGEHLFFSVVDLTTKKVIKMLSETDIPKFKYEGILFNTIRHHWNYCNYNYDATIGYIKCDGCGEPEDGDVMIPVDGKKYCLKCSAQKLDWCRKCGKPFLIADQRKHRCEGNYDRRDKENSMPF